MTPNLSVCEIQDKIKVFKLCLASMQEVRTDITQEMEALTHSLPMPEDIHARLITLVKDLQALDSGWDVVHKHILLLREDLHEGDPS